jgi:ComF family protein
MENLINKIFPSKCMFCDTVGEILCEHCLSNCPLSQKQHCIVCDRPAKSGVTHKKCFDKQKPTQFIHIYEYAGNVRKCINKSKYSSKRFMALKTLSYEGSVLLSETGASFEGFAIVPIPLSNERAAQRGFNQAEVIAQKLSYVLKLKIENSILTRTKKTIAQHKYGRRVRFANVKGAFEAGAMGAQNRGVQGRGVRGKKVLLVDDISTTGATFLEAAKTLREAGVKEVRCFALSKKLKRGIVDHVS